MKKTIAALVLALGFTTCTELTDNTNESSYFTKSVGGEISLDDGERWAARYVREQQNGRTLGALNIPASALHGFVSGLGNYVGLHFKYGIDDHGQIHVLVVPKLESSFSADLALDAYDGSYITLSTVTSWTQRYVSEDASRIRSYFFGRHVFDQILSKEAFENLEVRHGISDSGEQELLLYAWNTRETSSGRKQSNEVDVYDMSYTCPTRCDE
ncbi:MAG TPA: hypothetical protein VGD65_25415 [Chryseosolibacter sp.]